MKNFFPKTLLLGLFFLSAPASLLAESKDNIRFSLSSATGQTISVNCGNFSYPGHMNSLRKEVTYTIQPKGLVWNPRQLSYYCYAAPVGFYKSEIAHIRSSDFDRSKPNSEVALVIHHIDPKTKCARLSSSTRQALIIFSLSVDGKLIQNRSHACLF